LIEKSASPVSYQDQNNQITGGDAVNTQPGIWA